MIVTDADCFTVLPKKRMREFDSDMDVSLSYVSRSNLSELRDMDDEDEEGGSYS